jgi:chemotaxis protein CheD
MDKLKDNKYVGVGKVMVAKAPECLFTVVGSCLAVTLYNRDTKVGGMAHILMAGEDSKDTKYVRPAIETLLRRLKGFGGEDLHWVAKLTGGSAMTRGSNRLVMNAGRHTALQALKLLIENQFDIVGMHVGGDCRRGIHFDLITGEVQLNIEGSKVFENSVLKI